MCSSHYHDLVRVSIREAAGLRRPTKPSWYYWKRSYKRKSRIQNHQHSAQSTENTHPPIWQSSPNTFHSSRPYPCPSFCSRCAAQHKNPVGSHATESTRPFHQRKKKKKTLFFFFFFFYSTCIKGTILVDCSYEVLRNVPSLAKDYQTTQRAAAVNFYAMYTFAFWLSVFRWHLGLKQQPFHTG